MKSRTMIVCGALLLVVASTTLAQAPAGPPKPGPEHAKLGYYVGTWSSEGEAKTNPFMPAGKYSGTDTCSWFDGKFAVVCHSTGKGPMGPMKGLGIMSYNTEEKVYTYYSTDNSGMTMLSVPRGTVQGDTWVYEDESKMGGKTVKGRYTIKQVSPDSYTWNWEMQGDNGTWSSLMDGKSTRKTMEKKAATKVKK